VRAGQTLTDGVAAQVDNENIETCGPGVLLEKFVKLLRRGKHVASHI
jgi:hypothetical protein